MGRLLAVLVAAAALVVPAGAHAALPAGDVHIGAAFSTTGAGGTYGGQQSDAAQLAVDEVNASGVLGAARLVLDVRDSGSDPATAGAAFTQLIDGGAVAVLGPTLSTSALRADRIAQSRGVPVLGVSDTADGILGIGSFVFRVALSDEVVEPVTVAVSHRRLGYRRAAIVWERPDAFSKSSHDVFQHALKRQHGVKLVADASFASSSKTGYEQALRAAARQHPDVLFLSALAPDLIKLMTAARDIPQLKHVPFVGGDSFNTPGLIDQAGDVADGAISGAGWIATEKTPGNAAFVQTYRRQLGYQPDQFSAQAYTGVKLLALAIQRAGSTDPRAIRDQLARLRNVDTVLGRFSFDAQRAAVFAPVVQQIRAGQGFVKIGP